MILDLSLAQLELLVFFVEREQFLALILEFLNDSFLLGDYAAQLLVLALVDAIICFKLYESMAQLGALVQGICTFIEKSLDVHETYIKLVLDEETLDALLIQLVFLNLSESRIQMLVKSHSAIFRLDTLGLGCIFMPMFLINWWLSVRLTVWKTCKIFFE